MSNAEIVLGSRLYVDAVNEGLPATFAKQPEDYATLKLAFRDMSRQLVAMGAVAKDDNGNWIANDAGIDKLGEKDNAKFLAYYQTVTRAHDDARPALIRDGHAEYSNKVHDLHVGKEFEIEPETITRVRREDMQAVAQSSMMLLEAVQADPANAAFVKGLERNSMDTLWSVMEKSGYLMPGENPDRTEPLSNQTLRGTPEEQDALLHQASVIAANVDLGDAVRPNDRPAAAALAVKAAVANAQTEQVAEDRMMAGAAPAGFDSDLTNADSNSLFNVISAGARLIHTAQWDTQSLDTVVVDPHRFDDLKVALDDYHDKGIDNALSSGNFGDPKIDPDMAKRLAKGISWLSEAIVSHPDDTRFFGDYCRELTMEGATMDEASTEFDNAFDQDTTETDAVLTTGDEDMAADQYGKSDNSVRLTEALVSEADGVLIEMIDNGTAEYLRQRAGRAETDLGEIASSRAAFGTLEEAMGEGRVEFIDERRAGAMNGVVTAAQKANMSPEKRAKLRTARIEEGRGPFKEYRSGAQDIARSRMKRFLDDNMVKDGRPNHDLHRVLRDATQMPVEAKTRAEGEAFRDYAEKFAMRSREERKMREELGREKRGVTKIDFEATDVRRFIQVAEAAGTQDVARVTLDPHGAVSISHPDAPKLTSSMDNVPTEIARSADATKKGRPFGGNLPIEMLKAAYQTGADKVTLLVDGETPYGIVGKTDDVKQRTVARKQEDIVLS